MARRSSMGMARVPPTHDACCAGAHGLLLTRSYYPRYYRGRSLALIWMEHIPGGTQDNGLETGLWGVTAARIAWYRLVCTSFSTASCSSWLRSCISRCSCDCSVLASCLLDASSA